MKDTFARFEEFLRTYDLSLRVSGAKYGVFCGERGGFMFWIKIDAAHKGFNDELEARATEIVLKKVWSIES
jgi:hypothetical protein